VTISLNPTNGAPVIALNAVLRTDLAAFVRKVFATVSPGARYLSNWHIRAICHELEKVMRGETKRLIITMPPRYLKSISASVAFPAWVLGHDPTRQIVCVSYAQELSTKLSNDCRAVMNSEWYGAVFPGTKIDPSKNTEAEFITTERGMRLSTSVGGVLTGRGGDIIIVDDPTKPSDGLSEVARARTIEWYGGTLISRLNDKERGAIVVVMQRLHQGDLVGHLLEEQGWHHLNLPAIAELEQHIEIGPGQFHIRRVGAVASRAGIKRSPRRHETWDGVGYLRRAISASAGAARRQHDRLGLVPVVRPRQTAEV
jgi:hypothetical protein